MSPDTAGAVAWLFPGQGAQKVGMGRDLYDEFPHAREIFDRADAALDRPLTEVIFQGPEEDLLQTANTQPAILVTSIAALAAARDLAGPFTAPPRLVAGHSLGEYSALIAAGALTFEDGVRLVQERGRLMQMAGERNPGAMAAVIGLSEEEVEAVCRETGAEICNINSSNQISIGGTRPAVARATDLAQARGAKRVVPLKVFGAFHSSLMRPAADGMRPVLDRVTFQRPSIPVVANVTATALETPQAIHAELASQVCSAVRWRASVDYMVQQGVRRFVEFGPGAVLTGLVKTIAADVQPELVNINSAESLRAAL